MFRRIILSTLLLAFAALACQDSGPLPQASRDQLLSASNTDYYGSFVAMRSVIRRKGLQPQRLEQATVALWCDDTTWNCYGGSVLLNGDAIPWQRTTRATIYLLKSETIGGSVVPIQFGGSWHVFEVAGNGSCFPPFKDSVRSPTTAISITYPTENDSVSRADGLAITWNSGSGRHQVLIRDSSKYVVRTDVGTSTSYTVPSGVLRTMKLGEVRVEVQRHRNHSDTSGTVARSLVVGSSEQVHFKLVQ